MPKSILFQLIVNCYMLYKLLETWPAFKRKCRGGTNNYYVLLIQ